uniref:Acyl-CoA binding domain containing 4 n=1 Tax=Ficedula albicollis TaxID=59894 RepID=A0A803W944_FICAL
MAEPGCGAQFRAAVQVIQGLPRSGAYRPSYEEMLRFYSYYKQATAGCCQGPRPGFWDPIGRYKWDAWHSLGRMSKEEAMAAYVAEMKKVAQKVIDTVPMDESTEEMFRYFEPLYEVIHDMPRPPESFFRRRAGAGLAPAPEAPEGSQVTSDTEGDTFCDTLEQMEPEKVSPPEPGAGWCYPGIQLHSVPRTLHPQKCHHEAETDCTAALASPSLPCRGEWGVSGPFSPISQAGQGRGLTPSGAQAGAEPPVPHSAGQGERGEGRRAEGSSSTDLTALGSERGGCRARPCALCCCCPTSWAGLGWSWGLPPPPGDRVWLQHPTSLAAEGSHKRPVSAPLGPQAVQWLYSCRTQPFLCPFPAVVQICLNLGNALLALQQPGRECCWCLAPRAQLLLLVQPHQRCLWTRVVPGLSSAREGRG